MSTLYNKMRNAHFYFSGCQCRFDQRLHAVGGIPPASQADLRVPVPETRQLSYVLPPILQGVAHQKRRRRPSEIPLRSQVRKNRHFHHFSSYLLYSSSSFSIASFSSPQNQLCPILALLYSRKNLLQQIWLLAKAVRFGFKCLWGKDENLKWPKLQQKT